MQSGFLTLHTLVMMMKMHSYMNINGYLQSVSKQAQRAMAELRKATEAVGGWDEAIATAKARRQELDQLSRRADEPVVDGTPPNGVDADASVSTLQNGHSLPNGEAELRRRLNAAASTPDSDSGSSDTMPSGGIVTTGNRVLLPDEVSKPGPHPLVDHPNEKVAALAREFSELDTELVSSGPEYIRWPNNISYKNFGDYLLIPTLVYELEYPRTNRYVVAIS